MRDKQADQEPDGRIESDTDKFLSRLEQQLDDIETNELLDGVTGKSLQEKGFIGDKEIEIRRAAHRHGTEKEQLVFEPGVEFDRLADAANFEELEIETVLFLKDVDKNQLIATRSADEQTPFGAGNNVARIVKDNTECYHATARGKVVIIRDALHVFPSDINCTVETRISLDRMHTFLTCSGAYGYGNPLTPGFVLKKLAKRGVKHGIDREAIDKAVEAANQLRTVQKEVIVASGTPARQGDAGRADYEFGTEAEEHDFRILPDGRIDYKNSTSIVMAEKDDLLATIVDPQNGIPGVNVLGETVAASDGSAAFLTAGNGVKVSDDGKQFFAETKGNVVLNGTVLEVVKTYAVSGDVDYTTGNIHFNGTVLINGNVREGFEIEAEGDIMVSKNVESARLKAGRDVVVKRGIQGKGKGLVAAGRDIRASYAQNARLEAQGNVYIENSAINSHIFTSKYLKMQEKRGVVIGGEVCAQRGIDVKMLGSENGVKTYVDVGTDYLVVKKIAELDQAIDFHRAGVKKIDETLRAVSDALGKDQPLAPGRRKLVKRALAKKNELEQRLKVMFAKKSDLVALSKTQDVCFVKVSKTCFPDVYMKIRGQMILVSEKRENVRFYEDRKDGEIKTGAY